MVAEVDALSLMDSELLELSRIELGRVPLALKSTRPLDIVALAWKRLALQVERAYLLLALACRASLSVPTGLTVPASRAAPEGSAERCEIYLRGSMNKRLPKVLFLCTHNSARSQMAEAFLRNYAGDRFEVYSAGLEPGEINPFTRRVMAEAGVSLEGQRSKGLTEYVGKVHFNYLVTVCDRAEQQCPLFPGMGTRLYWSFEDPSAAVGSEEEKKAKFRQVRDEIRVRVLEWISSQ